MSFSDCVCPVTWLVLAVTPVVVVPVTVEPELTPDRSRPRRGSRRTTRNYMGNRKPPEPPPPPPTRVRPSITSRSVSFWWWSPGPPSRGGELGRLGSLESSCNMTVLVTNTTLFCWLYTINTLNTWFLPVPWTCYPWNSNAFKISMSFFHILDSVIWAWFGFGTNSVDFSKSRISEKKCVLNKHTIKVRISCS